MAQIEMADVKITYFGERIDEFGGESSTVGFTAGDFIVTHTSFRRGGCLHAGTAVLRNWRTGGYYEVDITSEASDRDTHVRYLLGLAEKHVGNREEA